MATDLHSAWLLQPTNPGFHQRYISTVRAMALYASLLGETPASMAMLKNQRLDSQSLAARLARMQLVGHEDQDEEEDDAG